jgi:hypothetical protein
MSDELNENISWTPYLEKYFADTGERSICLSVLHQQSEAVYSRRRNFISLPAIVLSGVIGFGSVGSSSMFAGQTELASIVLGIMSLFVSMLQAVESFFQWSKRAENHRLSGISYAKLHRFIAVEMRLPQRERIRASDFLKMVKDTYDRLQETSPAFPPQVISDFKKKFNIAEYKRISKPPEANGLEEIIIYRPPEADKLLIRIPSNSLSSDTEGSPIDRERDDKV